MASRGSVIPLFVEQIKSGQALTITDPDMTRFLMSLEEAVELVVFAFANAQAGDIMVQKSPASTIGDLAQALLELFDVDNEIRIIGTRHGEKLYETLLTKEEYIKLKIWEDFSVSLLINGILIMISILWRVMLSFHFRRI
jgi:UDP-glucose 4-epimerase